MYVEDQITLIYLKELWDDPSFAYFVGGGHEAVRLIVRVDREAGHSNVFGLIDRDFGHSNLDRIGNPGTRVFRLAAHEVENYLLDAAALASSRWNNLGRSIADVEGLLIQAAQKRCWYEACRSVLAIIRGRFHEGFIVDPPQDLADHTAAHAHLCGSPWFINLADNMARTTEAEVARLLTEFHAQVTIQVDDGTWRRAFAGKEVFKDIAGRICDQQKLGGIRSTELHGDLAQAVAAWQQDQGQIPEELAILRTSLRARVGLV